MANLRWVMVAALALLGLLGAAPAQEEMTPEQRQEVERRAQKLFEEGLKAYQAGRPEQAAERWRQVLPLAQRLYPASGHPNLALTLNAIGVALAAAGRVPRSGVK